MEDFATAIMGTDGLPERRLQARYYVRFQPRGDGQLARPRMTFYSDGENPLWMARSKRGWVSPDGDELRLSRRVRLRRPASPGRADLYVRTEELLVRSDEETARSELPVYATLGPHEMRGTGMIADLHSGRLQLLSEVEGRYEE